MPGCGAAVGRLQPLVDPSGGLDAASGVQRRSSTRFLDEFARMNPSIAAGNGLHQHDDTLEDFSAAAIAVQVATWRQLRARAAGHSARDA